MQSGNLKALVVKTNNTIPALIVAIIGFGLALFTEEISRMSSLQSIAASGFNQSIANFVAALMLVILAIVYKAHPKFRVHRRRLIGVMIGIGMSFCVLYSFDVLSLPESPTTLFIIRCILRCLNMALLACWAEVLLNLSARQVAVIFALSLFALGGINALSAMLKSGGAYTIVALTPLLSILFLYWFKDRLENDDAFQRFKHIHPYKGSEVDHSLINKQATFINSSLVFLLPLLCFPFIFGIIHNAWIPAQDGGTVSTQIQLGAALGTILAGVLLLLLITHFWGRRRLELYNLIVLPILLLVLFLTTLLEGSLSVIYITPLNIVQKCVLFFIWMSPYLIPCKSSPLAIWALAELLYQTGKGISTLALNITTANSLIFMTCVISVILVISVVIGIMLDQNKEGFTENTVPNRTSNDDISSKQRAESTLQDTNTTHESSSTFHSVDTVSKNLKDATNLPSTSSSTSIPSLQASTSPKHAIGTIAQHYRLTQREEEVLELLAQGMKASSIAEDLFISTSTAKSHIRNIYAKLGIHTQSELLLMVHQKESEY